MTETDQQDTGPSPFYVMDCTPVLIATGLRSFSVRELKDSIAQVHPGSLYHHFWGRLISPTFDEPEYTNDFAAWAFYQMHDKTTAEMLSVLRPRDFDSIESLRRELVDILEIRLDESEKLHMAVADQPFHFVRSQLVIFNTGRVVERFEEMGRALREMTLGSIFYHYIEAARRIPEGKDDFTAWIETLSPNHEAVCKQVAMIDPYFSSLKEIRATLVEIFETCFPAKTVRSGQRGKR